MTEAGDLPDMGLEEEAATVANETAQVADFFRGEAKGVPPVKSKQESNGKE